MAGSKRKVVRQKGTPKTGIQIAKDPDYFYKKKPSWAFLKCDIDKNIQWSFYKKRLINEFWDVIFPKLREFESMTWEQILIDGKKQNHGIIPNNLNKCARDRLCELHIEAEAIYSLRLGGSLRIYGYIENSTYYILWYDDNHGDNDTCVCRSFLKHT